jgi:hypothetical protein
VDETDENEVVEAFRLLTNEVANEDEDIVLESAEYVSSFPVLPNSSAITVTAVVTDTPESLLLVRVDPVREDATLHAFETRLD